jgi:hypothetical protein
VVCTGTGTFRALWNNAPATAGRTVSLKTTATDTAGATVTQTVTNAVAVAAS